MHAAMCGLQRPLRELFGGVTGRLTVCPNACRLVRACVSVCVRKWQKLCTRWAILWCKGAAQTAPSHAALPGRGRARARMCAGPDAEAALPVQELWLLLALMLPSAIKAVHKVRWQGCARWAGGRDALAAGPQGVHAVLPRAGAPACLLFLPEVSGSVAWPLFCKAQTCMSV